MSHYLISEASRLVDEESHVLRYWEEELALKIPRNDLGHRYYTEVQLNIFRTIKDLKQQGYQLKEIKQYLEDMEKGKVPQADRSLKSADEEKTDKERPESAGACGEEALILNVDEPNADDGEHADDRKMTVPDDVPLILPQEETADKEAALSQQPSVLVSTGPVSPVSARQQTKMREFRELMTDILVDAMEVGFDRMSDEISDQVSRRVIKEMNYLDREREEWEEERFRQLDESIRSCQRRGKYRAEAAATIAGEKRKKKKDKHRFG